MCMVQYIDIFFSSTFVGPQPTTIPMIDILGSYVNTTVSFWLAQLCFKLQLRQGICMAMAGMDSLQTLGTVGSLCF